MTRRCIIVATDGPSPPVPWTTTDLRGVLVSTAEKPHVRDAAYGEAFDDASPDGTHATTQGATCR